MAVVFVEPNVYQRGVGVIVGTMLIVFTLRLLRRFHIREEHGIPWLFGAGALILLSLSIPLLKSFTGLIGAGSPVTALFGGCIVFLLLRSLAFSITLSQQKKQIRDLAIELAFQRVKDPPGQATQGARPDDPAAKDPAPTQ